MAKVKSKSPARTENLPRYSDYFGCDQVELLTQKVSWVCISSRQPWCSARNRQTNSPPGSNSRQRRKRGRVPIPTNLDLMGHAEYLARQVLSRHPRSFFDQMLSRTDYQLFLKETW